ncbi:MAG: peptidoglycan-associated lipoprotein Pal [Zoogloeaceae bacterium]|jgi:peptidoglycan-associated lipoprotein|nr:peptidoglycan-associated lipoprotein Pal [Zoogloeaceae bacterium]
MKPFSLFAACAFALLLAACGTTNDQNAGAPVEGRDAVTRVDADGMTSGRLPAALTDPSSPLSKRSIYFALDRYDVSGDYSALVAAHARFLTENPSYKILIQGNTDERGSREYNLSLGQKRADAVRRAMMLLGVKDDQIEAVSLGEEKPRAEGHDESAWSENRRADILYPGEY